jgi:hypothetical protein
MQKLIILNYHYHTKQFQVVTTTNIRDFTILKTFKVTIHHPNAPVVKEIIWNPPLYNWTKCNIDGACSQGKASCSDIFRNHDADFMFYFAEPLGNTSSYLAELCDAMRAIEIAYQLNW